MATGSAQAAARREGNVTFERVLMTPELARKLLEWNVGNRRLDQRTVRRYMRDLEQGQWQDTGDSVKVTWPPRTEPKEGDRLLDGQHRLTAIVQVNKSQHLWVAHGVSLDARGAIDQGKGRPVGQQMQIVDGNKHGTAVAARVGVIRSIERPDLASEKLTYYELGEWYAKHHAGIDWSLKALSGRHLGIAPFAGTLAYCYPTAPAKIAEFAEQVRSGENITRRDPAYVLRELIRTTHTVGIGRRIVILATLHCAKSYIEGKQLSVIRTEYLINPRAEKTQGIVLSALRFFGKVHGFQPTEV